MTSSDVLDTCFSVQLARATDLLLEDLDKLLEVLKRRALEHKHTVCIGRSHAHPRRTHDLRPQAGAGLCGVRPQPRPSRGAQKEIATCAISGAVGTFANIDPAWRPCGRKARP